MKKLLLSLFIPLVNSAQILPNNSDYNQNIIWESVFTDGAPGKVNRGLVDSDGNYLVNQNYDPNKWVLAKDALFSAIENAEINGHKLYNFNKQIPILGGINEDVGRELSLRASHH